jgi:hypothetical protein
MGKDMEGLNRDVIEGTVVAFAWRNGEESWSKAPG